MHNNGNCPVFENLPVDKCSGCEVCVNACPNDALFMEADSIGFKYPQLDSSKCIECGICSKICPMLNISSSINHEEVYYMASHKSDDVLVKSASGGMFTFLVEQFKKIYPNGYIVGAIYSDDYHEIKHYVSNTELGYQKMRSSKYFQSSKYDVYKKVKEKLNNGDAVFFSGSPCETAGLHYYLKCKEYANLWTMDYVCKGCSSPKIYKDYVEFLERKYDGEISYLNMRYKWLGLDNWIPQFLKVEFKNKRHLLKEFYNTELGKGFQILQRESCYSCPFREKRHYSDYTIGDMHGADETYSAFNQLGTSVIIINNSRAKKLWSAFDKSSILFLKLDKESVYSNNRNSKDERAENLKEKMEVCNSVKAVRSVLTIKDKIKMILPVMIVRKITSWRRKYKR